MSQIENQPVGQLFGLFGLNTDESNEEINQEEGEYINKNGESVADCEQNVKLNEEINRKECCICKSISTKYRCPSCQLSTCSLKCCQTHKQKFNCNGIRNKLAFVKMSDYSEQEFISDYLFLEDADRTIDNNARERRTIISSRPVLPKWLQKLIREARFRGIHLKLMPAGFQKRKQNTSCFMYNEKAIHWDIECKFPHALEGVDHKNLDQVISDDLVVSHSEFKLTNRRVPESTKLSDLVSQYVAPNDIIANIEQNRKLSLYQKCGVDGISVLFKLECQPLKHQKYIELDMSKTIADNLVAKTIIEFPTFVIILNKFKHLFHISTNETPIKPENADIESKEK